MNVAIKEAQRKVEQAERELVQAVHEAYPVGCECLFRRSPRCEAAIVKITSYGAGTMLKIHNEETGSHYALDALNNRLERIFR